MINSKMQRLKVWLKAMRVPFFTAAIIPVALGSVAAWRDAGRFMWFRFWLTMLGAVLMHAGTNLANDYFDHISGCDRINKNPTPFSGGSRVIQEGLVPPKKILYASLISFSLASAIGMYLNYISGSNVILILGIIGVFLAFFYTAKPIQIAYTGFGELAVGIGFGPLIVMGSYFVQAQGLPIKAFFISIPVGILIALVLFINEFPDYEADIAVGKRTLVVRLGKKRAVILYQCLLTFAYLAVAALVLLKFLPVFCLIAGLSFPLFHKALKVSQGNYDKIYELLPANALTIGLHSNIGLLLCLGIALDKIF